MRLGASVAARLLAPTGVGLLVIATLALALVSCKNEGAAQGDSGTEDLTIVVEADKSRIMQEEQSLLEKRTSFEKERERLGKERSEIEQKLSSLSKKDRRQRDELETQQKKLAEEERRVRERAKSFESERDKLEQDKSKLLERISKMTATKGGMTIEQREQVIAAREKDLAAREKALAEREARAATREGEAGKRLEEATRVLADLQSSGGLTKTVVVNNPSPAGGGAPAQLTKASVDKQRRPVRARMDQKGILLDDLPPAAKTLWQTANKALEDKDFASASESLGDLEQVLDGIVVNGDFVKAKMNRVNRDVEKKGSSEQIKAILAEISEAATEGRFDRANKKINQIVALLGDK